MPASLDDSGLVVKTLDEIQSEITTSWKDGISQELDTEEESELGQIAGAFSAQLREVYELLQAAFNAGDPYQGSGFGLTQTAGITGTDRAAATRSETPCTVTIAAGSYLAGTLITHVSGQPETRFRNKSTVVSVTGTVTGQIFESEDVGPIVANSGTLTVIAETVSGWTAITNTSDATLGALTESDSALRLRRIEELYRRGSTSVEAIKADLLDVSGVTYVNVLENTTLSTDGNGLPGKSVEAVVLGGTDAAVRAAVFAAKAGGIQAYGSNSGTITDTMGNSYTVAFSRPTAVPLRVRVTYSWLTGTFPSSTEADAAITDAVEAVVADFQTVGRDVIISKYVAAVSAIYGIADCSVETAPSPYSSFSGANRVMAPREYMTLESVVTVPTEVAAYP